MIECVCEGFYREKEGYHAMWSYVATIMLLLP